MNFKSPAAITTIIATIFTTFIGFSLGIYFNRHQPQYDAFSSNSTSPETTPSITPVPTPQVTSQISPDGSSALTLVTTVNSDGSKTYTFSTTNQKGIYFETLDTNNNLAIPFNTWSPDNKYFFIEKQDSTNQVISILVFKASGQTFANDEKYLDVTAQFAKRDTGYSFIKATGWASETLIVFNTIKSDGTKGPSYWFETPSKAIIQLSSAF